MWKGTLTIGPTSIAVKLVDAAAQPTDTTVSFNQAHRCTRATLNRMTSKRWCPACDKEVAQEKIVRVFEHTPTEHLEISDADIKACEPAESHALELIALLDHPPAPAFVDSLAYLVPDGESAAPLFDSMRLGLGKRIAIGELVLRKRQRTIALQVNDIGFNVFILRGPDQMRTLTRIPTAPSRIDAYQLRQQLEKLPAAAFTYSDVRDLYQVKVRRMVQNKVARHVRAQMRVASSQGKRRRAS
jgi:DNA end-binding protein Ku